MDAVYPDDLLPMPLLPDRAIQNGDTNILSQMVSGRRKTRLRFDSVPADVTVTWLFKSAQQVVLFESWYRGALNNGNRWFTIPLRFALGRGPWRVRMANGYSGPTQIGANVWRISAPLEIYERPILDGDWAEFYPEAIIYAGLIDLALNLEWPESPYQTHMGVFDQAVNEEWPQ